MTVENEKLPKVIKDILADGIVAQEDFDHPFVVRLR